MPKERAAFYSAVMKQQGVKIGWRGEGVRGDGEANPLTYLNQLVRHGLPPYLEVAETALRLGTP